MFNRNQKKEEARAKAAAQAQEVAAKLSAMQMPPPPAYGPITLSLLGQEEKVLAEINAKNAALADLQAQIAWWKRNQLAEEMFVKVAAILDSLRLKETQNKS